MAPPHTPLGEFTALPQAPSYIWGGRGRDGRRRKGERRGRERRKKEVKRPGPRSINPGYANVLRFVELLSSSLPFIL